MLIIPDIHERIDQLKLIDSQFGVDEPRIYLGDWMDAFGSTPESRQQTLDYLASELTKPDRIFLWGNHDYQYTDERGLCSGYKPDMAERISKTLPQDWPSKFIISTIYQDWLISHAGFNKNPEEWDNEIAKIAVGHVRGGRFAVGGPLWLDWNHEFKGLSDKNQIVGHTNGKHPRLIGGNLCIDCSLNFVVRINREGMVEIIKL